MLVKFNKERHQKRLESEQQYPVTIKASFSVQKVSDYNIIRELTSKKSHRSNQLCQISDATST
jgi:hypothetical protein